MDKLLEVKNLTARFAGSTGMGSAVSGVSFDLDKGEVLGIAGESGSGKTVTAMSMVRLLQSPAQVTADYVRFRSEDLMTMPEHFLRELRGSEISMIFQDPVSFLNPVFNVGQHMFQTIRCHKKMSERKARLLALETLEKVGLSEPEKKLSYYPHQLSGGMAQRVMIALAIVTKPSLLIADEPSTSLDVTLQVQIIDLLLRVKNELNNSIILITHNLAILSQMADRVHIMYAGEIVEKIAMNTLFSNAFHPYTRGLIDSLPRITRRLERLNTIPGNIPDIFSYSESCRFADRCERVMDICRKKSPPEFEVNPGHFACCWLASGEK
ncbi:MAG: ABC transporter ATP-binding protein [Candidatus Wallbacteria bacterium]|nr:ABC transporter ATP-binding protein [Candidatus Wallbacteria bacterium]